jgi:hypothetical protein
MSLTLNTLCTLKVNDDGSTKLIMNRCKYLTDLKLTNVYSITNISIDHIIRLSNLERLDVTGTNIDSEKLVELMFMPKLKNLNCYHVRLNPRAPDGRPAIEVLRSKIPQVNINENHFKIAETWVKTPSEKVYKFWGIYARSQPKLFQYTRKWKLQAIQVFQGLFQMTLRVIGHEDREEHFPIYALKSLKRLKEKYAEQIQIPVSVIRFLYGGYVINDNDTPYLLEMKDNDLIHALY